MIPSDFEARVLVHALVYDFVGSAAKLLMKPLETTFGGLFRHLLTQVFFFIVLIVIFIFIIL